MARMSLFSRALCTALLAALVFAAAAPSATAAETQQKAAVKLSTTVKIPNGEQRVLDILDGQDHVQAVDAFLTDMNLNTAEVRAQLLEYVEAQLERLESEASTARKPLISIPVQIKERDEKVMFDLYDGDSVSDAVQEFCKKHVVADTERINECGGRLRDRLDEIIWQATAPEGTVETIPIFVRGVRQPLYIREDMTALEMAYEFAHAHQLLRVENARQYLNKLETAIHDRILTINRQREDAAATTAASTSTSSEAAQQQSEEPRETATLHVSDTPYHLDFLASVPSPVIAEAFCGPQGLQLKDDSLRVCVEEAQRIIEESRVPLTPETQTQAAAQAEAKHTESKMDSAASNTAGELSFQIGDAQFPLEITPGAHVDVVARSFCTTYWPDLQDHLAKEFSFADSPIDLKFCATVVAESLKRHASPSA